MTCIGFYVKAGAETGYGHIVRCLTLADALKARGATCWFYTNDEGLRRVSDSKHSAVTGGEMFACNVWIVDLEGGCPPGLAAGLRDKCDVLVILNGVGYPDGDPGRLLADLVFYQGVTRRPYELDWTGFGGEWYEGPNWLILRKSIWHKERLTPKRSIYVHDPPQIVVAGGGSDPKDVTGLALHALRDTDYRIKVIVGPANPRCYGYNPRTTTLHLDPPDVLSMLAWADVGVVSYGMTAFECLAVGTPVIALSISEDHRDSADTVDLASKQSLVSLGLASDVAPANIRNAVGQALSDVMPRSEAATRFVDGLGVDRVAMKIINKLEAKK